MKAVRDFLEGFGPDSAGRRVHDVLAFDDDQLERRHDFIQWLFPLAEASRAVPGSPVLTPGDIAALRASPTAQAHLRAAAERMVRFYAATDAWRTGFDHNHLRITRIVRSLRLLAGDAEGDAFRRAIMDLLGPDADVVNPQTRRFWSEA